MDNAFFADLPYEDALAVEQAARLIFELRENRTALLRSAKAGDEAALIAGIRDGSLPEHPSYEQYLSASILGATRLMLRQDLAAHLAANYGAQKMTMVEQALVSTVITPPEIRDALQALLGPRLAGDIRVSQDALNLQLDKEFAVELRVLSPCEYSFAWRLGTTTLRIDTAPSGIGPSHLHAADGSIQPDPLTVPGRDPLENIHMLLDAILKDPLLKARGPDIEQT